MELRYSGQAQGERVVAASRLAVAIAFLLSLQLDARVSGFFRDTGRPLVWGYAAFAIVAAIVSWRRVGHPRWPVATHVVDVVFFAINLLIGDGTSTPRYISFLFPLFASCMLFSWRAGLVTTLISAAVYGAGSFALLQRGGSEALLSEHFVYRSVGYAVLSALALWFRAREEKVESEIAALSAWPHDFGDRVPTRELLERVAALMEAPRVLLAWEEPDEPWLDVAWKFGGDFQWIREAPTKYESLVHDELGEVSFVARDASKERSRIIFRHGRSVDEWSGCPVSEQFRRDFNIHAVMAVRLVGTTFSGWLFVLDRHYTPDDLMYGELVGRLVISRLDQYYLLHRAQQLAVGGERLRLSRDLHDGVLQSLTGASLQIEAVRGLLERDPAAARERLEDVQAVIATDQRELRSFIRQLRPAAARDADFRLSDRLHQLAERFRKQWGISVELDLERLTHLLTHSVMQELYSIVSEAVANAAKHAHARTVRVLLESTASHVHVCVTDDGRGFPFAGRFTLAELNDLKRGPVTLKERIAYLGGDLVIESTQSGSTVDVSVPFDWMGA